MGTYKSDIDALSNPILRLTVIFDEHFGVRKSTSNKQVLKVILTMVYTKYKFRFS
jgi:hypothetical protein